MRKGRARDYGLGKPCDMSEPFKEPEHLQRGYEDSANLAVNSITALPASAPVKTFTFTAKQLFDAHDSAKLKNQKILNACGEYLAQNQFGVAVVEVSSGMEGDTQKELVLTEARAMVVREFLAENFGFDDSLLKTMGVGKQAGSAPDAEWGTIQILIFPTGTKMPADKKANESGSSASVAVPVAQVAPESMLK